MLAKDNPFPVARQESVCLLSHDGTTIDQILAARSSQSLRRDRGPKRNLKNEEPEKRGTGKTTLLLELGQRLSVRGQVTTHVAFSQNRQRRTQQLAACRRSIARRELLLVDGAQRFSAWPRNWLFRISRLPSQKRSPTAGLIVTLHRRPWFFKPIYRTGASEDLLRGVLEKLEKNDLPTVEAAKSLFVKNRGNIRLVLRGLYDQYARPNELADRRFALKSCPPRRKSRGQHAQR